MLRILTLCALLSLVAACSGKSDTSGEVAASFFKTDIAPLFRTKCATCHLTGQEAGKMALTPQSAIANIVGVKSDEMPGLLRVVPGAPDKSYLVMKLEGTHIEHGGNGAQMPFGAPPLTPEEIAKIRLWIADGAKE